MRRIFSLFLPVLAATWLLTSCAALQAPRKPFSDSNEKFLQALRWQEFESAAHYLTPPFRSEFLHRFRALDGLRVVDVEPESVAPGTEKNSRITWSVMQYYLLPSITVKKFRFRLKWRALGADPHHPGPWRIVSPFPPFP